MTKIFATDLDGTFIEDGGVPSEKTIEAMKLLQENGYNIIGASGRVASSIKYIMNSLGVNSYIIGNNGAIILDKDNNVIFQKIIDKDALNKIIEICDNYNVIYHMYDKDTLYSNRLDFNKIKHMHIGDNRYSVNFLINKDIKKTVLDKNTKILKLAIYVNHIEFSELYNMLKSVEGIDVVISGDANIDCNPKNVSKGFALEKLAEILNIDREKIVAIGDQENDIEMIKFAGKGISMGNGINKLKNQADFVTSTIQEEGFYHAVEKIIKIDNNII